MGTRGREGVIKGAFGRQSGVDMRMQGERLRTVLSSKWRVDIVDEAAAGSGGGGLGGGGKAGGGLGGLDGGGEGGGEGGSGGCCGG
jgi:hypothetical protein